MAIVCTVRIPHALEKVQKVEADNPQVMDAIMGPAMKYMTAHRRFATDGEVLDLDEFSSREDYDKFMAEAGPAIQQYGELLGAPAQDTIYTLVEGG